MKDHLKTAVALLFFVVHAQTFTYKQEHLHKAHEEYNIPHGPYAGLDLSGAGLSGMNLSGANLRGTDLSYADLTYANLTDADLTGADMTGALINDRTFGDRALMLRLGAKLERSSPIIFFRCPPSPYDDY